MNFWFDWYQKQYVFHQNAVFVTIAYLDGGDGDSDDADDDPEKSRIINSIFWAILDIEGFPFFLGDVWESWGPSGTVWGLGRNLYPK